MVRDTAGSTQPTPFSFALSVNAPGAGSPARHGDPDQRHGELQRDGTDGHAELALR